MLLPWDFRLSLDFFDSGLYTCTAVARLTLALAKLSCIYDYKRLVRRLKICDLPFETQELNQVLKVCLCTSLVTRTFQNHTILVEHNAAVNDVVQLLLHMVSSSHL